MKTYDYYKAVKEDIRTYLDEEGIIFTKENYDELYEKVYDDLFINDAVTGNASGSYTFSTYEAEENLCHNFDLLQQALEDYDIEVESTIRQGAEVCDVIIRCYILGACLTEVINEKFNL